MTSNESEARAHWVVVTGATGGMGQGIVKRCLRDGYKVLAIGRSAEALEELQSTGGGAVQGLSIDLASPELEVRVEQTLKDIGGLDDGLVGLVNCAGISQGDSIAGITDADWQRSLDVNVTAPMRLARVLVPYLSESGSASIVNIGSPVALVGARKVSYSASKAALLGLNAALASDLGPRGIRVNAVLPGATITGMTSDWSEEKRSKIAAESPFGRLCTPEDIAGAVSFLLGPDSTYITGSVLNVTGGKNIGL